MNEKTLNIIYKKLCEGFKINFIPRRQFEDEIAKISPLILNRLTEIIKKHRQLKYSKLKKENSQIIKVTKKEYILDCFNSEYSRNYSYGRASNKYNKDNLSELESSRQKDFKLYSEQYDEYFENETNGIIFSLPEFILSEIKNSSELFTNDSIENEFWKYFENKYLQLDWNDNYKSKSVEDALKLPENIIKNFSDNYLSNKFIKLLDRVEKNLSDETITSFDQVIINVGIRDYETSRSGWSTNSFTVFNNKNEYHFTNSSKDEKLVKGEFINIFIHQKKHLIKISVTLNEVERIPYIIYRDCEKVSLKNESEIVIIKHHGNETIVFDERKEALTFQTKLIEIREGMGRQK